MTPMKHDSIYASHYRNVPALSREEELALVHRWRTEGNDLAHARLVEASMRHVVTLAHKLRGYPVSFGDLVSEGTVGLLLALDKFDPERGYRLVTYANYWIRAYMYRAVIREWGRGRTGLGRRRSDTFFKLRKALASFFSQRGLGELDTERLASKVGVSEEEIPQMLDDLRTWVISLDAKDEDGPSRHERVSDGSPSPEEQAIWYHDNEQLRRIIDGAMSGLTAREQLILHERFLIETPVPLRVIGDRLGVTRERVRQLQVEATNKLRGSLQATVA